jgi:hypothetical protein
MSKETPLDALTFEDDEPQYQPEPPQQPQQQYAPQQQQQYAPQPQYQPQQAPQPVAPAPASDKSMWLTLTELAMSPVFLKAIAVVFVIAMAAMMFPVEDYILKHVSFAESVPHAGLAVKALVIATAATFWNPPKLA